MAISTDLYTPQSQNSGWRIQGSNSVTGVSRNKSEHSERALFDQKKSKGNLFLIVQDAFPCHHCHEFFEEQSKSGKSIIFKITGNNGSYSADHGLSLKASTPRVIYYHTGTSKMVSMSSRGADAEPPALFPPHPDLEHF